MELKKESGVVKMVHFYQYRDIPIFIRNYYDCYEFIFAIENKVFTDYIQIIKTKNKKDDAYLKDEIIHRLVSIASRSIDKILEERSLAYKIKNKINEIRKFRHQWFDGFKLKIKPDANDVQVGVPKER